jgi:N-acetylglucosamine-6-phosphate deacetylase
MRALAGGDVVLPDRVIHGASIVIDGDRIAAIETRTIDRAPGLDVVPTAGLTIVPGFVDVHVHGVEGADVLGGADAVRTVAARLPR